MQAGHGVNGLLHVCFGAFACNPDLGRYSLQVHGMNAKDGEQLNDEIGRIRFSVFFDKFTRSLAFC